MWKNSSKTLVMKLVIPIFLLIIILLSISLHVRYRNQLSPHDSSYIANDICTESVSYIRLVDNYFDDEDLSKLYEKDNVDSLLKKFNEDLNQQYDFFEISFQAFQSLDRLELEHKFYKKYGKTNETIKNQEVVINEKKRFVSSLNTIQINQNAYNAFINHICEGRGFQNEDFIFNKKSLPIILGYDYQDYYKIGDIWKLNYLEMDINMEIIGFLDKDIGFCIDDNEYILNTYICSPSFQIETAPANDDERTFQLRYYLQKNIGYIRDSSKQNDKDSISEQLVPEAQITAVKNMAAKYDLNYTTLTYTNKIDKLIQIDKNSCE